MYTQTLYELSQEAERLLQLSDNSCSYWKKYLSLYPETMRHNWLYPGVSLNIAERHAMLNNELRKISGWKWCWRLSVP